MICAVVVIYYLIQRKMSASKDDDVWKEFDMKMLENQTAADAVAAIVTTTGAASAIAAGLAQDLMGNASNCTESSNCVNDSVGRLLRTAAAWAE